MPPDLYPLYVKTALNTALLPHYRRSEGLSCNANQLRSVSRVQ